MAPLREFKIGRRIVRYPVQCRSCVWFTALGPRVGRCEAQLSAGSGRSAVQAAADDCCYLHELHPAAKAQLAEQSESSEADTDAKATADIA